MEIAKIEQIVFITENVSKLKPVVASILTEEIEGYMIQFNICFDKGQALKMLHRLPDLHISSLATKLEELLDIEQLTTQTPVIDPMKRVQNILTLHTVLRKLKPAGHLMFEHACGIEVKDCDKLEILVERLLIAKDAEVVTFLDFARSLDDARLKQYDD